VPFDVTALRSRLEGIVGPDHVAGTEANALFAVDGVVPSLSVSPGTQDEVSKVVASCSAAGAAMIPRGGGTAMGMGNRPSRADAVIRLDRLNRVVEYDPANLCITAEAGMRLGALQQKVAGDKEILPIDPPDDDNVTMGGLVAANQSGPSRLQYGTARDWVLGMRVVLPDGEKVHCGGRTIKNVSGYDMNKLFIKSFGTLGIVTEVTLKLLPAPVMRAGLVGLFPILSQAAAVVTKTLESFLLPEALDLMDPGAMNLLAPHLEVGDPGGAHGLAVALAGSRATVERQVRDFETLFRDGGGRVVSLPESRTVPAWSSIRNVFGLLPPTPACRVVCKIAVPIEKGCELLAAAGAAGKSLGLQTAVVAHAGSGVVWAAYVLGSGVPAESLLTEVQKALEALRQRAAAVKGSLVLCEAPPGLKARMDAWGPPPPGLSVMKRIKAEYDPKALCSPGRYLGGM
jgi:glycolate oxidase FAD binding subunit